jgi:hypothetical protein
MESDLCLKIKLVSYDNFQGNVVIDKHNLEIRLI